MKDKSVNVGDEHACLAHRGVNVGDSVNHNLWVTEIP